MGRPKERIEDRFWRYTEKTETCWLWTGSKSHNGYGQMHFYIEGVGTNRRASHTSLFLHTGRWPTGIVMHTCHTPACVRPDHLVEGSQAENIQMSVEDRRMLVGIRNGSAKLADSDVVTIREAYAAGESQTSLGRRFGVAQAVVSGIVRGKSWPDAGGPISEQAKWKDGGHAPVAEAARDAVRKLTPEQVIEMRKARALGISGASLAKEFGMSQGQVSAILHGRAYAHVGGPILPPKT